MKKQRAAFRVSSVEQNPGGGSVRVLAHAILVSDTEVPQAERFHEETPSGSLELIVTNKELVDTYGAGEFFYMDLIPIPVPESY